MKVIDPNEELRKALLEIELALFDLSVQEAFFSLEKSYFLSDMEVESIAGILVRVGDYSPLEAAMLAPRVKDFAVKWRAAQTEAALANRSMDAEVVYHDLASGIINRTINEQFPYS